MSRGLGIWATIVPLGYASTRRKRRAGNGLSTREIVVQQLIGALRANIRQVFMGHEDVIDTIICCLLARGHVLIEDVPGVGKTVLATAVARSTACSFARIQLTPDLLPGDVLGVSVYNRESGEFQFKKGPIFASIILADEINRTTPRTQTALLEAMSDGTVSMDGKSWMLPQPFMVIATQNPYEFEGTYPLPENQLDRFLMRIRLGYPDPKVEARILELRPGGEPLQSLEPVVNAEQILELQRATDAVRMDATLMNYIIELATATRRSEDLILGLSTRGCLALAQAARGSAVIAGRDYCIPEDVLSNVTYVAAHRVILRAAPGGDAGRHAERVLASIMQRVKSPA